MIPRTSRHIFLRTNDISKFIYELFDSIVNRERAILILSKKAAAEVFYSNIISMQFNAFAACKY